MDTGIHFIARDYNYHNQVCWEYRARTGNGQERLLRGDGQRIGSSWKGGYYPGEKGAKEGILARCSSEAVGRRGC